MYELDLPDSCTTKELTVFKVMHKKGLPICGEWQKYSIFKQWYNTYPSGGCLTMIGSTGEYSPTNCAVVPRSATWVFTQAPNRTGDAQLTGAYAYNNKFKAALGSNKLGLYDTKEQAHLAYAKAWAEKARKLAGAQRPDIAIAMRRKADEMLNNARTILREAITPNPEPVTKVITTPAEDMELVNSYTGMVTAAIRGGHKFQVSFDEYRNLMLTEGGDQETDVSLAYKYQQKQGDAKVRGIEFSLSFDKYRDLKQATTCEYTGVPFVLTPEGHPRNRTLERINPDIGYTDANTFAVTAEANALKNVLTDHPSGTMDAGCLRKLVDSILGNQALVDLMNQRGHKVVDRPQPTTKGCERKTFAQWRSVGRTVIKGQKATGKTAEGTASFAMAQTRKT